MYFLGIKNADEAELKQVASDPDNIHMYNVADFALLVDIVEDLSINLCNSVKGPSMKYLSIVYLIGFVHGSNIKGSFDYILIA